MLPNLKDTIAAIATPSGQGAVGIVRLSGPESLPIARKIFRPQRKEVVFESHKMIYGKIYDDMRLIDEVLVCYMAPPNSFTGEAVVEIFGHGGTFVMSQLLAVALKGGARLACPGEFSYRAVLYGKIDLTQAEAIADVIEAKNNQALSVAQNNLNGLFSKEVKALREKLVEMLAHMEAEIDFSTEEIEEETLSVRKQKLSEIVKRISDMLKAYQLGQRLYHGVTVVICGRPNVGKSSLLNAILKRDRAIVSDCPGTTRDTLEETIHYRGISVSFIDTAGIRETHSKLEQIGVSLAYEKLKYADLKLLVLDSSQSLTQEDLRLCEEMASPQTIFVQNKSDLNQHSLFQVALKPFSSIKRIPICALKREGIDTLLNMIYEQIIEKELETDTIFLMKERHRLGLEQAIQSLSACEKGMEAHLSMEFLTVDLKKAIESLETVVGRVTEEDIYDKIFSTFCIGK
ncbi:MAG: tRNA uridine-5-carboxymethylaminomethyl(34) synthesis GTPase MnmE [Deltaproteobacteria bacterium]|nr:tRNA uridine-5-carboxymethylaminomethyl(34) synthesis GTPase MnmE [Deltaproteobacteria bacterium]